MVPGNFPRKFGIPLKILTLGFCDCESQVYHVYRRRGRFSGPNPILFMNVHLVLNRTRKLSVTRLF